MATRYKLSGAPLGYTLGKVDGTGDHYRSFGKSLWSEDRPVSAVYKELLFLRTSVVNQCST